MCWYQRGIFQYSISILWVYLDLDFTRIYFRLVIITVDGSEIRRFQTTFWDVFEPLKILYSQQQAEPSFFFSAFWSHSVESGGTYHYLVGGFKYFLFSPLPGEMIQFDKYFAVGLKPPTSYEVGLPIFNHWDVSSSQPEVWQVWFGMGRKTLTRLWHEQW